MAPTRIEEGALSRATNALVWGMEVADLPFVESFWGRPVARQAQPLRHHTSVDVAIIGGGLAGLSSARCLKEAAPSLSIAVLESRHVGFGASGRCMGLISPVPPSLLFGVVARQHGADEARWMARYLTGELKDLESWLAAAGVECDYRRCAALMVARNDGERRLLGEIEANLAKAGVVHQPVPRGELQDRAGFGAAAGIVLNDGVAVLNPWKLGEGLRRVLTRHGVAIHEPAPVRAVRAGRDRVEIVVEGGAVVSARQVVVATNGYTPTLRLGRRNAGLMAVHSYLLATDVLDDAVQKSLGSALSAGVVLDVRVRFNYSRLYEGRLLFGGSTQLLSAADEKADRNAAAFAELRSELLSRYPRLAAARMGAAWGGPMHLRSLARMPSIGPAKGLPNVLMNVGYNQGGVALAAISGRSVCNLLLNGGRDLDDAHLRQIYDGTAFGAREVVRLAAWMYPGQETGPRGLIGRVREWAMTNG